jgi:hypothetical protein
MWQERRFLNNPKLRHLSLAYNKFRWELHVIDQNS